MTWGGTALSEDQREVCDMVFEWRDSVVSVESDKDTAAIETLRDGFTQLGVWSIGMPEQFGGGEAELSLRLVALAAVAGRSAALAWACAQAHAAVEALAGRPDAHVLAERITDGSQAVGVIDISSPGSHLTIHEGHVSGTIARVDAAGRDVALVLLDGDDTAWVLHPSAVHLAEPYQRTGLAGANTAQAEVNGAAIRIDADVHSIRSRLRLAGAAIAAGLALDAAEYAASYAASRMQFGGPLTAIPAVRRSLELQRSLAIESLSLATGDNGQSIERSTSTLTGNVTRAVDVAAAAVQSHGGYGYIKEYGVATLLRDAVSLRAAVSMA